MDKKDKLSELQNRLSEIFYGVDDYYSQALIDELIARIDKTITSFNSEFKELVKKMGSKPAASSTTPRKRTRRTTTAK